MPMFAQRALKLLSQTSKAIAQVHCNQSLTQASLAGLTAGQLHRPHAIEVWMTGLAWCSLVAAHFQGCTVYMLVACMS
jgi:hypothetical protein